MNYYPQTTQQLKNYRDYPALSSSFLKQVLSNSTKQFKETVQTLLGSYYDALMTCPNLVDELYCTESLVKRPSENIKGFLDQLYQEQEGVISQILDVEGYKKRVIELAREANYQPNWGDDAVWKSVLKDGESYWAELLQAHGRKILTKEETQLCAEVAGLTLSSSVTAKYFQTHPNVDKYFQADYYWISENEPCKGLIDLLVIEHETKIIYLIDIKTTSVYSIEEWFMVAKQKNYPLQLSFYLEGVKQNHKEFLKNGYTIQCKWIVIPMNTQRFKPWIIPCTDRMLDFAENGYVRQSSLYYKNVETFVMDQENDGKFIINGGIKETKGWRYAIQQYKRAKSEGLLDYDLLWFDQQGKMSQDKANKMFYN